MALGDPRIEAVHQAGKLDKPGGGVGRRIIRTRPLSVSLIPLSCGPFEALACGLAFTKLPYITKIVKSTYSMCHEQPLEPAMSFTEEEITYLRTQRLARIATFS